MKHPLHDYVGEVAHLMGLRDWVFDVKPMDLSGVKVLGEADFATSSTPDHTHESTICVNPEWMTWSRRFLRHVIVHELMHSYLSRIAWSLSTVKDLVSKSAFTAITASHLGGEEVVADTLSRYWAETLPLPPKDLYS